MRKLFALTLAIVLLAPPALAAIVFDTVSSDAAASNTVTHSHTFAADANIAIICLAMRDDATFVLPATSVTVGGVAATFLVGQSDNTETRMRAEIWYKLAPATGSQTIVATGDVTTDIIATGVLSFSGVAQTSTFNTSATATGLGTDADVDSIASAVGELAVLCGNAKQNTGLHVAPDATSPVSTEIFEDPTSGGQELIFVYTEAGAVTSINMRTDLSASTNWAAVAVSMRPLVASTRRIAPAVMLP